MTGNALTASCECRYFKDRESVCKHIWAVAIDVERKGFLGLGKDGGESVTLRPDTQAEAKGSWQKFISEVSEKIARAERDARPPRFRDARDHLRDRSHRLTGGAVGRARLDVADSGQRRASGARPKPAGVATRDVPDLPDPIDREIVPLLLGASDVYGSGYVGDRAAPRSASPGRWSIASCRSSRSRAAPCCASGGSRATR